MNQRTSKFAVLAIVMVLGMLECVSAETIVAFRDINGKYSSDSHHNLTSMIQSAKLLGTVEVWVTFDMLFQADPALRTPEVIQSEDQIKQWHMSQIIGPVIASGEATLLDISATFDEAPGCMVSITAKGLRSLSKRKEVKHLSYYEE